MKSISVKRIVVGSIALVVAICTLLSLCFTVLIMDYNRVLGSLDMAILEQIGLSGMMTVIGENGFNLLGGDSKLIDFIEYINETVAQSQVTAGVTVEYATYGWLSILSQIFNILILISGVAAIAGAILWFFFCRSYKLANCVAIVGLVAGVLYLAEGILFYAILQNDLNEAFPKYMELLGYQTAPNVNIEINVFATYAYWPLILIVLLISDFW